MWGRRGGERGNPVSSLRWLGIGCVRKREKGGCGWLCAGTGRLWLSHLGKYEEAETGEGGGGEIGGDSISTSSVSFFFIC